MNANEIVDEAIMEADENMTLPIPEESVRVGNLMARIAELGIAEGERKKGRISDWHTCPKCEHTFLDVVEYEKFKCGCGGMFDIRSDVWPSRTYCGKCGQHDDSNLFGLQVEDVSK